ncbi:hypothetical protein [Pseudomonas sp. sp1636]|uniref:hypothetical protein n=1 Tax=Pseudomonas sp. sp1636 TaxID=3036707 RepID=UPI0035B6A496
MKQMTFADAEYAGKRKLARKELLLIEMNKVVPWMGLIALIDPYYPKDEGGRPTYVYRAVGEQKYRRIRTFFRKDIYGIL